MRRFRLLIIIFSVMGICLSFYGLCSTPFSVTLKHAINNSDVIPEVIDTYSFIVALPSEIPSGDDNANHRRSTIIFTENGIPLSPHRPHDDIRKKGKGLFSHWNKHLIFSSTDNSDPRTNGKAYEISYTIIPGMTKSLLAIFLLSSMCLTIVFRKATFPALILFVAWTLKFSPVFAVIMAIVYILTVIAGFIAGHALPPASIFYFFPYLKALVHFEPNLPHLLLAWSLSGATWAWLAHIPNSPISKFTHGTEEFILALLIKWGWIFVLSFFMLQLGCLWSGVVRSDMHSMSIAGFVPFNDSGGYFCDIGIQNSSGLYSDLGSQRPVAAAFRTVIWFLSGGGYANFLMAQTFILAFVVWLATSTIARWRGIWAAACFLSFLSIMIRPFLSTFMTETSGLIFAVLGITFIITSLRKCDLTYHVLGLAGMTLALFARMGALFMIPALLIWTGWRFRFSRRICLSSLAVSVFTVFLCWFGTMTLSKLYGSSNQIQGANFSYVTAGLSLGVNYADARDKYASDLSVIKTKAAQARFLYAKTIENIRANPGIIGNELLKREWIFLEGIVAQLFTGYGGYARCPRLLFIWFMVVSVVGWFCIISKKRERGELAFYIFLIVSIIVSAPFVIYDDGWRVLMSAYPVFWMAISSGLVSPSYFFKNQDKNVSVDKFHFSRLPAVIFFILCFGSLLLPTFSYHFTKNDKFPKVAAGLEGDGTILLRSGKNFAGMLVLLDGESLLPSIPSIHYSDFVTIIRDFTWFESYMPLITPTPPAPPFALITVQNSSEDMTYLIAPVDMLRRKDVPFWLIKTVPWPLDPLPPNPPKYRVWNKVVSLKPVADDGTVDTSISF